MQPTTPTGAELIAAARAHQLTRGYTVEHDLLHESSTLLLAAEACIRDARYQLSATRGFPSGDPPARWPWGRKDWKARPALDQLAVAGAYCAAAIDRQVAYAEINDGKATG